MTSRCRPIQPTDTRTPEAARGRLPEACVTSVGCSWHPVSCSSMTMRVRIQLLAHEQCWSISTGSCLTNLLTALISRRATTTCLPTWGSVWDHNASTVMGVDGRCQNVAKLTDDRLLWHRHTKTYFPIRQIPLIYGEYFEKYLKRVRIFWT
jgi:hypothetical protein